MDGTTDPGNGIDTKTTLETLETPNPTAPEATAPETDTPSTDGQVIAVEAFTSGFDFNDDHCSSSPEVVLEDLRGEISDELFTQLDTDFRYTTPPDAHSKMLDLITDIEEQIEDFDDLQTDYDEAIEEAGESRESREPGPVDGEQPETSPGPRPEPLAAPDPKVRADLESLLTLYTEAAERFTYCSDYCCCASDAYDGYGKEWINDSLTQLGSHTWAVRHVGWPKNDAIDDLDGELDIDDIWNRVNTRDGWSTCELKWDGHDLHVGFSGYSCGTYSLLLTPLSDIQLAAWEAWAETDSYALDLAARVVEADPAALAATLRIWQETPEAETIYDEFESLLAAVTELGADVVADLPTEVVARLAPGWAGTKPELLLTARDILGLPHITAVASFGLAYAA